MCRYFWWLAANIFLFYSTLYIKNIWLLFLISAVAFLVDLHTPAALFCFYINLYANVYMFWKQPFIIIIRLSFILNATYALTQEERRMTCVRNQ